MTDLYRDDPPAPAGHGKLIATLVVVLALAAGVVAWLWLQQPQQAVVEPLEVTIEALEEPVVEETETLETLPPEVAETVELEVVEEVVLPELGASTAQILADLTAAEQSIALLQGDQLIRNAVVFVDNLRNGLIAREQSIVVGPQQAFRVLEQNGQLFIDPRSYDRYNTVVDWFVSLDSQVLLQLLNTYRPLVAAALAEIGYPDTSPEDLLNEAIAVLNATPSVGTVIELTQDSVMYRFADPALEALPDAQKQMIRLGPDNMRRVKLKLNELASLLQQP